MCSFNADLSNWDTSSVSDMQSIFQDSVVSDRMSLVHLQFGHGW
jgi:surface protein